MDWGRSGRHPCPCRALAGFRTYRETRPQHDETGQDLIELGYRVKILTARAQDPDLAIPPIREWLKKHGLPELEITNAKDMDMIELWDDRCVQVVPNTGNPIGPNPEPYRR